jgi:proline iminopeptidase
MEFCEKKTMKQKMKILGGIVSIAALLWSCDKEINPNEAGALVPKTVTEDPGIPAIQVNGTRLHSEAFGNPADPMVIYLHGGPGADYRNGQNVKNLVNSHYYVVFFDQRGSGLSARHPKNSYTVQLLLDDLAGVIQHYRSSPAQKVFLLGHSWGAMLATAYVNKYPTAINGVILAEPGGFTNTQMKEYSSRSRRVKIWDEATNDALYPDQFLNGKEDQQNTLDYQLALTSAYSSAPGNDEGIEGPSPFWRFGSAILKRLYQIADDEGFDFRNNLQNYTTKVLFLYSENNKAYGRGFAEQLAASFPKVQIAEVKGTGHEMIYFKWDNVASYVIPYLDSLR